MPRIRSRSRDLSERFLVDFLRRALPARSPGRAEAAGRRLGLLVRRLDVRHRRLAEANLARAFPEKKPAEVTALSRDVFSHLGGLTADLVQALDEPMESILGRVSVDESVSVARAAAASGRGLIFMTPHLGNWEFSALVTGALGIPVTVVARPLDNRLLDERLRAFRQRTGNTVVSKADAAREVLRVLRRGGVVGLLPDQRARPPDALTVPFFGRPALTTSAPARFAARTEALLLPASCLRTGPARYVLTYHDVIDVRRLTPEERSPEALTARIARVTETLIRLAPEQWLWLHDRWRLS